MVQVGEDSDFSQKSLDFLVGPSGGRLNRLDRYPAVIGKPPAEIHDAHAASAKFGLQFKTGYLGHRRCLVRTRFVNAGGR
jgi:hypothetical protein